ncbi:MAG: 1-acyl-sn-glycerol-3-phosphate acyltransferase [Rhodospirillaceae bacterium]|nr:MAG: 1-acyl-sn-glycerol-3-phosphate acyltransferase [Rhodospirillaceae bacterium]
MIVVRSALFNILFVLWTVGLGGVVVVPGLVGPRGWTQGFARLWVRGIFLLLRGIVGIRHEIRGLDNLPRGPVIIAAKHQSAWDTLVFHTFLDDPVFIVKRELFALPIIGWLMRKSGCIGIDRSKGARALKKMAEGARRARADGRQLVVFPEGTRTALGNVVAYQPGVAMLSRDLSLPVVPVALNSGLFWGRRSFMKRPGRIVLEILPAMPAGLERHVFMAELQSRIESASRRLAP